MLSACQSVGTNKPVNTQVSLQATQSSDCQNNTIQSYTLTLSCSL
ncbi:hypothetical protein [Acinetobacter pollinis]|nr:hypothetical protein [Acinetobacter pollinis]